MFIFVAEIDIMSKLNVYYNTIKVKNEIEFIDKILEVYSILNFSDKNKLVPHERAVLVYYIRRGLSEEILQMICEDDPKYNMNYLHGINKKLRDKGFLVKDAYNHQKFNLNEQLELLRKKFIQDKAKGYIIRIDTA